MTEREERGKESGNFNQVGGEGCYFFYILRIMLEYVNNFRKRNEVSGYPYVTELVWPRFPVCHGYLRTHFFIVIITNSISKFRVSGTTLD